MPRGEHVFWSIYSFGQLLLLLFFGVQRWWFTLFGEWARLLGMLALHGTYRVNDKPGMKSVVTKGAYCDGQCFTVGFRISLVRVRTATQIFQEF